MTAREAEDLMQRAKAGPMNFTIKREADYVARELRLMGQEVSVSTKNRFGSYTVRLRPPTER